MPNKYKPRSVLSARRSCSGLRLYGLGFRLEGSEIRIGGLGLRCGEDYKVPCNAFWKLSEATECSLHTATTEW